MATYSRADQLRLPLLGEEAYHEHLAFKQKWHGGLQHAKKAGDCLNEAKRIKGGAGKWGRWISNWCTKNNVSRRTVQVYMRISRKWDSPEVVEARGNYRIDSIKAFMGALTPKPSKQRRPRENSGKGIDTPEAISAIGRQIRKLLETLQPKELEVLSAILTHCTITRSLDGTLQECYDLFKREVIMCCEDDSMYPEDQKRREQIAKEVRHGIPNRRKPR